MIDDDRPHINTSVTAPSSSFSPLAFDDLAARIRALRLEQARLDAALIDGLRAQRAEQVRAGEPEVVDAVLIHAPMIDVGDIATFGASLRGQADPSPRATSTLFVSPAVFAVLAVRPATGAERLLGINAAESPALPVTLPPPVTGEDDR